MLTLTAGAYTLIPDTFKNQTVSWFNTHFSFPIRYVRIEGAFQYLNKKDVKTVIEPLITQGFFMANMQTLHQALLALPWVDSAEVERVWPDAISVKVTEKKPYLRWGTKSLVTEKGIIFTPRNIDPFRQLILLNAPAEQSIKTLEIVKGISTTLKDHILPLQEFTIDNRGAWKIKLANELEIVLGREEQLKKLQRFIKTLPLLGQDKVNAMTVVDLRYPNGYAVSWKTPTPPFEWLNKEIKNIN
jgi:cell division protein FtsQ